METDLSASQDLPVARSRSLGTRLARSWFAIAFFLLLAIPALVQLFGIGPVDPAAENRVLAAPPAAPGSLAAIMRFPSALGTYLQDWFGLRQPMVVANNWLRFHLFHETTSPELLVSKHGRIFMSAHPGGPHFSLIYNVCGAGIPDGWFEGAATNLASLIERARRDAPNLVFVIAPGAATLYSEDLRQWVWAPCRGLKTSAQRIVDNLANRPDILDHVVYPIDILTDLKRRYPVIPSLSLHWAGEGPLRFAEILSEKRFGMTRTLELPTSVGDWPSDLNRLNPGLGWVNHISWPDLAAAGVSSCLGAACTPLEADPRVVAPLDRYRSPHPNGKRLLVIADSFGDNIAYDFIEYYGEVWHIHVNGLAQLTRPELDKLHDLAFQQFHPDQVVFICNDFGMFYEPQLTQDFLFPSSGMPAPP